MWKKVHNKKKEAHENQIFIHLYVDVLLLVFFFASSVCLTRSPLSRNHLKIKSQQQLYQCLAKVFVFGILTVADWILFCKIIYTSKMFQKKKKLWLNTNTKCRKEVYIHNVGLFSLRRCALLILRSIFHFIGEKGGSLFS